MGQGDDFLTDAEAWLFREIELLQGIHAEIRDTHLKYHSWFIVAQSVLLAAGLNWITTTAFHKQTAVYYILCGAGLSLGVSSWLLQFRHMLDADFRMARIREINAMLRRPMVAGSPEAGEFMSLVGGNTLKPRRFAQYSYSRIRLIVDAIFPVIWVSLIVMQFAA